MTLNDLECPIHLKVRLVDGRLDVRLLRVSDSTISIGVARGRRESGLEGLAPPCGQLTRCFSAVAELLVFTARCTSSTTVQTAKRGLAMACRLFVCPSVRL